MKKYYVFMWVALGCLLAICIFFQIHNAGWLIGDEAIVIRHTGMGRAFSFLGFEGMVTFYGRLYPFAYTLYNVLLPFYDSYVPVQAIYVLQAIALSIFAVTFALFSLYILTPQTSSLKYATVFFFVSVCVCRVYPEFITCYTGIWIVYLFIPVFLYCSCRFMDTGNRVYGVVALLSINYITYCYETVFVIPLTLGACSLLFSFRKLSQKQRLFNGLLVGSGLLFLAIYVVFVLPKAEGYYHHYGSVSLLQNAIHMFVAHKVFWIASVILFIRFIQFARKQAEYTFFDSMLLSGFAYFVGAAVLKLNYTYYYNAGELVAFSACLFFLKDWIKPIWLCCLLLALSLFYGRKMPQCISTVQSRRTNTTQSMSYLSSQVQNGVHLYWFAPEYDGGSPSYLDMRGTSRGRIEIYLSWLLNNRVIIKERQITREEDICDGIWFVYTEPGPDIPMTPSAITRGEKVFSISGIEGYLVE